jgi:hypothetical protein
MINFNFDQDVFNKFSKHLDREIEREGEIPSIEFNYKYIHPLKKKLFGPSKLNFDDVYKVFFISPKCLIFECLTNLSGFKLMDTFYSFVNYKMESDFEYSKEAKRIIYKTKLSISFGLQFVKDTWFKGKIEGEALNDAKEYQKDKFYPLIKKILNHEQKKLIEKIDRKKNDLLAESAKKVVFKNKEESQGEKEEEISFKLFNEDINKEEEEDEVNLLTSIQKNSSYIGLSLGVLFIFALVLSKKFELFEMRDFFILLILIIVIIILMILISIYSKLEALSKKIKTK